MNFNKLMKKVNGSHILVGSVVIVLGYVVLRYTIQKSMVMDGMNTGVHNGDVGQNAGIYNPPEAPGLDTPINTVGNPQPSQPLGENSQFSQVSGIQTSTNGMPNCQQRDVTNPAELLPRDDNSEWAKLNPMGAGDLQNVNLLKSGYHIGINTVSSSLRNANLQVRSEPPNPQLSVGPWNNTTIGPDINRRPLEIGQGAM